MNNDQQIKNYTTILEYLTTLQTALADLKDLIEKNRTALISEQ